MPSPFLRPTERPRDAPDSTPGVCIRTADGRRFFFAGATEEIALAHARPTLGDLLDESARVEWGLAVANALTRKSAWSCQRVIQPGAAGLKCE